MQKTSFMGAIVVGILGTAVGCGSSKVDPSIASGVDASPRNEVGPVLDASIDTDDVDAAPPLDGGFDAGIDSQPAAPTICTITAKPIPIHPDAGDAAMPTKHQFSLLIDWHGHTATTGSGGTAKKVTLAEANGAWTIEEPLSLSLVLAEYESWARPLFKYTQMTLRPTATGCTGSAAGEYLWNSSDMLFTIEFTATLSGEKDTTPPAFAVFPASHSPLHPLDLVGVGLSELVPVGTTARWVNSAGGTLPMAELPPGNTNGISGFVVKDRALAFGSTYLLQMLPAAADLAGNEAEADKVPSITTTEGPGFMAQNGFEGAIDALLGGKVAVVDNTILPAPGGAKVLRFAPFGYGDHPEASCGDRFTARLSTGPGAKAVKLSAMSYETASNRSSVDMITRIRVAVPNGSVSTARPTNTGTNLPSPWLGALPGSSTFTYGTLKELTIPLPEGATDEVIFDIERPCWEPMLPVSGWIFDDLRVE